MDKCELYDVEVLDGYFSGVAIIYEDNKRYIVDISYDIEFEEIGLRNCTDLLYNCDMDEYDVEALEDLRIRNYVLLKEEIQNFIYVNGDLVFSTH
ncbi:MAG: hypothetical protein IJJ13_05880 [Lachnospiraceae bacterium]|nr:hypothetical protein [Lachnospiraceae bacterium]